MSNETLTVLAYQARTVEGSRLIREEDLGFPISTLPASVKKYLRQSWLPKGVLADFSACQTRVARALWRKSLGLPIGRVISPKRGRIAEIRDILEEEKEIWEGIKKTFLQKVPQYVAEAEAKVTAEFDELEQWQQERILKALRDRRPSVAELERRIQFRYQIFQVSNLEDVTAAGSGFSEMKQGLFGDLLEEIATDARRILGEIEGQDKVTIKRRKTLSTVVEKLRNLAFIDGRTRPLSDSVENAIAALPAEGPYRGRDLHQFTELVEALASPSLMCRVADGQEQLVESRVAAGHQTSFVDDDEGVDDSEVSSEEEGEAVAEATEAPTDKVGQPEEDEPSFDF